MLVKFLYILTLFVFLSSAFAEDNFILFEKHDLQYTFTKEYNQLLSESQFKQGDILNIGEYQFSYIEELGSGTSSKLLKVKVLNPSHLSGDFALRIPIRDGYYDQTQTLLTREFMDLLRKGQPELEENGITLSKTILHEKETFILHEIVEHDFNLAVFLQKESYVSKIANISRVQKSLIEFAKQTYQFENIADFHPGQLVYNIQNDKWTLLDWSESHKKIEDTLSKSTIFDSNLFKKYLSYVYMETGEILSVFGFPATFKETSHMKTILKEINQTIYKKRVKESSCQKMINSF